MRRYGVRTIDGSVPGPAAWSGGTCGSDGGRQPAVRRGGAVPLPHRNAVARSAGAGDWKNVHQRFSRWAKSGVWEKVFLQLSADADNEYAMIDSTIVRAHQHSAGAQKKPARTRRSADHAGGEHQIHALVDALGNPVNFFLTGGEAHDLVGADHLLPSMQADTLIADKAFDATSGHRAAGAPKTRDPPNNRTASRLHHTSTSASPHRDFSPNSSSSAIATRYTRPRATSSPPST